MGARFAELQVGPLQECDAVPGALWGRELTMIRSARAADIPT